MCTQPSPSSCAVAASMLLRHKKTARTNLPDDELLKRSTALSRVMFTNDVRFQALAEDWQRQGAVFAGLVYAHPIRCTIGQCVLDLEIIAKATDPPEWQGTVARLPL
jgi:hypothetical protein